MASSLWFWQSGTPSRSLIPGIHWLPPHRNCRYLSPKFRQSWTATLLYKQYSLQLVTLAIRNAITNIIIHVQAILTAVCGLITLVLAIRNAITQFDSWYTLTATTLELARWTILFSSKCYDLGASWQSLWGWWRGRGRRGCWRRCWAGLSWWKWWKCCNGKNLNIQ